MNFYQRHIGDYIKDTAHLSLLEHGIYGRLLDVYYSTEGPIPAASACRLIGARTDEEKAATAVILAEFFTVEGDAYRHARCDAEIARMKDKQDKAKASARASVNARSTNAERTLSERPAKAELPIPIPIPKEIQAQQREPQRDRGSRLPKDWALPDEWKAFAESTRPDLSAAATASQFRDYWHAKAGKDGVKLDWFATWRNWVRAQRAPQTAGRQQPGMTVAHNPQVDSTAAYLAEQAKHAAKSTPPPANLLAMVRKATA